MNVEKGLGSFNLPMLAFMAISHGLAALNKTSLLGSSIIDLATVLSFGSSSMNHKNV
jgi:hypothetical protein